VPFVKTKLGGIAARAMSTVALKWKTARNHIIVISSIFWKFTQSLNN